MIAKNAIFHINQTLFMNLTTMSVEHNMNKIMITIVIMNAECAVSITYINISELMKCYLGKIKSNPISTKVNCDELTNFSL